MVNVTEDDALKIKTYEKHGGKEAAYKYVDDNAWLYLAEPEEVEIRNLHYKLRHDENVDRENVEGKINKLWKKLAQRCV